MEFLNDLESLGELLELIFVCLYDDLLVLLVQDAIFEKLRFFFDGFHRVRADKN